MQRKGFRLGIIALAFVLGIGFGGASALAIQGHMWAALSDLQAANAQLSAALPDKAGHRVQAMNLVGRAINQVHMGIAAGAQ